MSEREWQPGADDAGDARGTSAERESGDARQADVDRGPRTEGATPDARNVEGVQGAQGGVERERR